MKRIEITDTLSVEDYEEIRTLYAQYYNETLNLEHYTAEAVYEKADTATYHATERKEESVKFWVAKSPETGEVMGFAKAKVYPDGVGVFNHIYVKPKYRTVVFEIGERKRNLFLSFKDIVGEWFAEERIHTIEIETPKRKPKLLALEERLDFKVVREFDNSILLRKQLLPQRQQKRMPQIKRVTTQ